MGMRLRHRIAALVVGVGLDFRQLADQVSLTVVAAFVVGVDNIVHFLAGEHTLVIVAVLCMLVDAQCLIGAVQHLVNRRSLLGVAFVAVGVLWKGTLFSLQRNCGQDQCIGRAEHHHTCQSCDHLMPAFLPLMNLQIFLRTSQNTFLHVERHQPFKRIKTSKFIRAPKTPLSRAVHCPARRQELTSARRISRRAKPEIRFFPPTVPPPHSPQPCSGSPPTWSDGPLCRSTGFPAPDRAG